MAKKILATMLAMILMFASIGTMAFASNNTLNSVDDGYNSIVSNESIMPRAGSNSIVLKLASNSASARGWINLGFSPTIKVTATGNSNMKYKVTVTKPTGAVSTLGYVTADGSSISGKFTFSAGGDYLIQVYPWEGSTNGKTATFTVVGTW